VNPSIAAGTVKVSKKQWVDYPLYRTLSQDYHATCFFDIVLPRSRSYTVAPDGSTLEGFAALGGGEQAGILGLVARGGAAQLANRSRLAEGKAHKARMGAWRAAAAPLPHNGPVERALWAGLAPIIARVHREAAAALGGARVAEAAAEDPTPPLINFVF
jgi:hypothetical protein